MDSSGDGSGAGGGGRVKSGWMDGGGERVRLNERW